MIAPMSDFISTKPRSLKAARAFRDRFNSNLVVGCPIKHSAVIVLSPTEEYIIVYFGFAMANGLVMVR